MKDKPLRIYISNDKWNDAKHTVKDGIVKKLSAAKQNLSIDKILLLLECIILNNDNNYTSDLYLWKNFSIELIPET